MLDETTCVPSSKYQSADEPEIINLVWQSDDAQRSIQKSFILDNGRLQLEPVKQAFGLGTVELVVGEFSPLNYSISIVTDFIVQHFTTNKFSV